MRRLSRGHLAIVAVVLMVAAACDPIVNAPPGGGEVISETFRIGPFDLSAMGQPGAQNEGAEVGVPRPSGSFGMKAAKFDLVDADGTSVPRHDGHLHHMVMFNTARQSMFCEDSWPERFAGSGQERTYGSLPDPYAYMVGAEETWGATWMIMNMSDEPMQVYIEYEIEYQPDATPENSRPVTPFFLDVTGCGGGEYDVPGDGGPGSVHTNTRTWQVPWDGYLVGAGGHVHGGGINVALRDEATGDECKMNAIYHDENMHGHAPDEMTLCPIHVQVEEGQEFSVVSRYHNDEPVEGAMGIVLAYAWEGSQEE